LVVLLALQAAGAIFGAIFVVPSQPVEHLKVLPDYTIPALALGLLVGGSALLGLTLLLFRSRYAAAVAITAGVAVMVFEIVEVTGTTVTIFTDPGEPALWQQPLWFLIGLAMTLQLTFRAVSADEADEIARPYAPPGGQSVLGGGADVRGRGVDGGAQVSS